jgi:hypothetical protein
MSLSSRLSLFLVVFSLFLLSNAQFQFFDGMFGHQQQQQQPSGGQQWTMHAESRTCYHHMRCAVSGSYLVTCDSPLLGVPLPRYPRLRKKACGLPVSKCTRHQVRRARCASGRKWHPFLCPWKHRLRASRQAFEEVRKVTNVCVHSASLFPFSCSTAASADLDVVLTSLGSPCDDILRVELQVRMRDAGIIYCPVVSIVELASHPCVQKWRGLLDIIYFYPIPCDCRRPVPSVINVSTLLS